MAAVVAARTFRRCRYRRISITSETKKQSEMKRLRYIVLLLAVVLTVVESVAQDVRLDRGARMAYSSIGVDRASVTRLGSHVVVDMVLSLDSLSLPANTRLVYRPYLKSASSELAMPAIVINGRRQQIMYERGDTAGLGAGATVVRRRNGERQTVSYKTSVPLAANVHDYDVVIREDLCGCGDTYDANEYLLSRRRKPVVAFLRPAAEAQKMRHIDKTAYIDFPVNRTELYSDYRRNPSELDSIIRTINIVKADKNLHIRRIEIHGYASPDGKYTRNEYLSHARAVTLKDYVRRLVALDDTVFTVSNTAEDWDGLAKRVGSGGVANRQAILDIISDKSVDYDEREWKIRSSYPDDYRLMLDSVYPALRRSDYHISYVVRPFSVDEARQIIRTKPQQLSLEEMFLVAQAYRPGSAEFNEVMEIAVRMYPDDPTANLNAACTRLEAGDADGAKPYLDKAGDRAQAKNALASYYKLKGEDEKAAVLYRQAANEGLAEATENLNNM